MEGVCSSLAHFLLGNINWPGRTYTPGIKQPSLQLPRVYSGQGSGLGCCSDNGADFLLVPKMLRRDQLHNKGRSKWLSYIKIVKHVPKNAALLVWRQNTTHAVATGRWKTSQHKIRVVRGKVQVFTGAQRTITSLYHEGVLKKMAHDICRKKNI